MIRGAALLICAWRGHDWIARGVLIYDGCWCSDEFCARCGRDRWWPS